MNEFKTLVNGTSLRHLETVHIELTRGGGFFILLGPAKQGTCPLEMIKSCDTITYHYKHQNDKPLFCIGSYSLIVTFQLELGAFSFPGSQRNKVSLKKKLRKKVL